jgi:tetratricopeptide (TPR) repeat protein
VLFDLSSPGRKNIIRVVYGVLALLFLIGFVGFGIGGELGGGGIVDSLTGGGGDGDTAEQFEQQIEDAEAALETNPADEKALATLAEYRYLSGQAQLDVDETTGAPILTDESRSEFEAAIDAWTRYLETDPQRPNVGAAGQVVQAYVLLGNAEGAAEAQEILAEDNPSPGAYSTLAYYYYADFDFKRGDEAAALAVEEANENQKKAVEKQLDQLRESAVQQEKRIEKQADSEQGAESALQSPFGGLDQGGGVPPTSP